MLKNKLTLIPLLFCLISCNNGFNDSRTSSTASSYSSIISKNDEYECVYVDYINYNCYIDYSNGNLVLTYKDKVVKSIECGKYIITYSKSYNSVTGYLYRYGDNYIFLTGY